MAHPTTPVVPRDGQLVVSDNTGTPISYTIVYEDGDFSIDEVQEDYANTASMKDRGIWYNERKTDEQDLNFTFTCHVTHFSSATDGSPLDAVLKKGKFASGVSVLGTSADVWATKWVFTVEATNYGEANDHVLTMTKVRTTAAFAEGVPAKWTIKGKILNPSSTVTWAT